MCRLLAKHAAVGPRIGIHTWHKPTRSRMAACATGVGHDQTRKNRACLAQRWAGSVLKNPVPFITVKIRLGRSQHQRIRRAADLGGWNCPGLAPGLGDELVPERLPVFAEDLERLGELDLRRARSRPAQRAPRAPGRGASADVSSPAVPTAPGCDITSIAGPASRSDSSTSTPSSIDFASCTKPGALPGRKEGE